MSFFSQFFFSFCSLISCGWLIFILPLPAVIDFTRHELGYYRSNNLRRFITGILLGVPLGLAIHAVIIHSILIAIFTVGWFITLEISVALLFCKTGHIGKYIAKYEHAAYFVSEVKIKDDQSTA